MNSLQGHYRKATLVQAAQLPLGHLDNQDILQADPEVLREHQGLQVHQVSQDNNLPRVIPREDPVAPSSRQAPLKAGLAKQGFLRLNKDNLDTHLEDLLVDLGLS